MPALYGGLQFFIAESEPALLPGTIGEYQFLGVQLDPGTMGVGVTLIGTPDGLEDWLDKIHALIASRRVEDLVAGKRPFGAVEDPHKPIYEAEAAPTPRTIGMQTVAGDERIELAEGAPLTALVGDPYSLANSIRAHLEAWVPALSDKVLINGFDAWTDDGDPVKYATYLNAAYEPSEAITIGES